jgi:hypothetical protein
VSDDVKTAVQSRTAETQMRAVQDYVSWGRRLEHSPEAALAAAWMSLRRARATSTRQLQDTRLKDIEAEYALRGLKPPHEPARNEMDVLLNTAHRSDRREHEQ